MLELRTLGSVGIHDERGRLLAASPKPLAMLVFLAVARPRGPQQRDTLLGLFYPELDHDRARNSLRQLVYALREAVGDMVRSDRQTVGLETGSLKCDVHDFEAALAAEDPANAVAAYRGPFLQGFFLSGSPEFEEWVESERSRLQRAYEGALEQLALETDAAGEAVEAVGWWRQLAHADPFATRVAVRLMAALEVAGDRAGALEVADRHAERLRKELDAEPSPEVEALARRLRAQPAPPTPEPQRSTRERLASAVTGRYRVTGVAGAGAMALVYRAEDLKLGRTVALKVLRPELAAAIGHERFLNEVDIAAGLSHPNILPVHDVGTADGLLYYVMPYVEGESLRARLAREGPLEPAEAVRIAREVAGALSYAHGRGIVHRDVKPANILLLEDHAVVSDFGVARAVGSVLDDPALAAATGTPAYMSPEQIAGSPDIDARTDLYSLGCVLYEMLTGAPPDAATDPAAAFSAKPGASVPKASRVRGTVPASVVAALSGAMAADPAQRFRTAEEFTAALNANVASRPPRDAVLSGAMATDPEHRFASAGELREAVYAATSTKGTVPSAVRARRRVPGGIVAVAVVVAIALGAPSLFRRGPLDITVGAIVQVTNQPGLEFQPALSPDGREVAYVEGPISRPRIVVRSAVALEERGELRLTEGLDGFHWFPAWSPDGESLRFAVCRGQTGGCATQQVGKLGGAIEPVFAGGASAWIENRPHRVLELTPGRSAWSRDGTRVAYSVGMDSLYTSPASIASPRLLTILESPNAFWPHSLTWSPDGRWIAFVDRRLQWTIASGDRGLNTSSVWIVDAEDGTQARITDDSSVNTSPQWLPDSRHLLFVSDRDGARGIYVVEVGPDGPRGEPRSVLSASDAHSISVSSDGKRMAYSKFTSSQNIWAVPITEGRVTSLSNARRVTTGNQVVESHSLSPDGRWLLFDSNRGGGNTNLYRVPTGGGTPDPLSAYPYDVYNPVLSPDGTEIVFHTADAEEGMFQLKVMPVTGGAPTVLAAFSGVTHAPDWSPDGLTVAFETFGNEGALHSTVWTVSRDSIGASWSDPRELNDLECFWPEWSPDGAKLSCWWFPGPENGCGSISACIALLSTAGEVLDVLDTQVEKPPGPWEPEWSRDGSLLYFFGLDADGSEGLWSVPATGGEPTKVIAFDDPAVVVGDAFAVGPDAIYLTVIEDESDIWVADLAVGR